MVVSRLFSQTMSRRLALETVNAVYALQPQAHGSTRRLVGDKREDDPLTIQPIGAHVRISAFPTVSLLFQLQLLSRVTYMQTWKFSNIKLKLKSN